MEKDKLVKVINKYNGTVGYTVPDLKVHRNFYPGESKEVSFNELEQLSYAPGGYAILTEYLEIQDEDAINHLFRKTPEPEYHYSKEDIYKLMTTGTLDQFLDCLDFAPESVKEIIKDMAVDLPLNDVSKRNAILDKMGFDVNKAIEIKNTKYDGGNGEQQDGEQVRSRRAAPLKTKTPSPSGRRYTP